MTSLYKNISESTKAYIFDKMDAKYFASQSKEGRDFDNSFGNDAIGIIRPVSSITVRAIMDSTDTPTEILEDLFFNSGSYNNKIKLLKNPNLPKHIVLWALKQNEVVKHYEFNTLASAALSRSDIPFKEIDNAIKNGDAYLVYGALSNPLLTQSLLDIACHRFLNTPSWKANEESRLNVLIALLENPNTSKSFLEKYQDSDSKVIQDALLDNSNLPSSILKYWFQQNRVEAWQEEDFYFHPNTPIELAATYLADYFEENDYFGNAEERCDSFLKELGYEESVLSSLPLLYKLKIVAE